MAFDQQVHVQDLLSEPSTEQKQKQEPSTEQKQEPFTEQKPSIDIVHELNKRMEQYVLFSTSNNSLLVKTDRVRIIQKNHQQKSKFIRKCFADSYD